MRTLIRARWVVAFQDDGHRLLEHGEVLVEDDRIAWVGRGWDGPRDRTLDAPDHLLIPGLITVHSHITNSPLTRSFLEDRGNPFHYMSGLYEYLSLTDTSAEDALVSARFSLVELLRSGVTTVVELGRLAADGVVELAGALGIRAYVVPMYRSGRWFTPDGRRVLYEWSTDGGVPALEQALEFIRKHDGAHGGRVRSFLGPAQIDTCTPALLRQTAVEAERRGLRVQIHAGQAVIEFQEIVRRHGFTPVEYLHEVGLLNERLIIGHCIYIAGHAQVVFPNGRDVELLAASGASVAHCPWVFGRRGVTMQSYPRYLRAGVNVALGTDTFPQDLLHEMRVAATLGKVAEGDARVATARDVFTSATLGGARALGRDDLGRIAPGARADLVLVRLDTLGMAPVRDPIRNLVFSATREDVETVMVDGRVLVEQGRVVGADESRLARDVQEAAERLWARTRERDWAHRTIDEISPPSFPSWRDP
ncbi:MAG TPA: chlorohydrolase family protein [Candidatus Tectomicrobia bacterium]|nr:chlorohydrolase family protein [Candidatus Tectomicrobia bacterium]